MFEPIVIPPAHQYEQMINDLFKDMGTPAATRIHAALGISGEAGELIMADLNEDRDNVIEEAGDSFFYVQKLLNMQGLTLDGLLQRMEPIDARMSFVVGMSYEAANLIDALKKSWVYEKELDKEEVAATLARYLRHFKYLLTKYGQTFETIQAANQWKLVTGPSARFPSGKYSNQAAIDRADKTA
jgi:phosphoribosyl-ATP pyrophosphohydrolase